MATARRFLLFSALAALLVAGVAGSATALDALPERLHDGVVGTPYSADLEVRRGCIPYTFKHHSGYLPPGLTVDPNPATTGKLSGTPTAPGWWTFYIELTDICGSVPSQGDWSVFIHPALVITTTSLPTATPGVPYSVMLTAQSGDASLLRWSLAGGSLPAGLTLREDGTISGTTTAVGSYTFVARVHDANVRTTTKTLGFTVAAQLAATAPSSQRGEVGLRFQATLGSTGGVTPHVWSVSTGSLPPGLAFAPATGAITGRPTTPGAYPLTFTVTDASGAKATVSVTLRIAATLKIATAALPGAAVGDAYSKPIATAGGVRPVRWAKAAGVLPPGIRLDPRTGVLSGTPRTAGTYRFTLRATDALGGTARKVFRLTVASS